MDSVITRAAVLAGVLVLAAGLGLWRRRRDGRVSAVTAGDVIDPVSLGGRLGAHATLVQFSSEICSQCAAARRVLTDVAARTPGVEHVEVDAAQHLDVVRRFDILRTPTVLVLDPAGRVVHRVSGAPTPGELLAVVGTGAPARATH
jgi:thiol-disulfide isomerase/thioredoxin